LFIWRGALSQTTLKWNHNCFRTHKLNLKWHDIWLLWNNFTNYRRTVLPIKINIDKKKILTWARDKKSSTLCMKNTNIWFP
jgi:tmRNA-binding protein